MNSGAETMRLVEKEARVALVKPGTRERSMGVTWKLAVVDVEGSDEALAHLRPSCFLANDVMFIDFILSSR